MYYYYAVKTEIELVNFNKYMVDTSGVIRNKRTGSVINIRKNKSGYNIAVVKDDSGKRRTVLVGRLIASLRGPPPTAFHTADHIDRNRNNDILDNIRWASKKEQSDNRVRPETFKTAYIVVKDGIEKTVKEWVEHFRGQNNTFGREYTEGMISYYAQKKQHGFSYKEYPNLQGEVWKEIINSKSSSGYWEISNMNRVKHVTKFAENVISDERICLSNGYPSININGRTCPCHILVFKTFFPDEYVNKKPGDMILHEDDDKLDFRPHKLRIGTRSENGKDAHDNGKYDDAKCTRMKCVSYIDGVFEKEYDSRRDALEYLVSKGFEKAQCGSISRAISGKLNTVYGRTWENTR